MKWTRQLVSASLKPHKNCGWKRKKKPSIECGDRVSVVINTIGNAYLPIFYLLPGKLFRDKIHSCFTHWFPWSWKQIRMANTTGICHGSTVFYVPVRLLRTPHSSSQITDHYSSAAKPWTCATKLDPFLFWL